MSYKHEDLKPYRNEGEKVEQIEEMFNNIAPEYDKFNYIASMTIDKIWRKRAILSLKPFMPRRVLDIATGTGDLAMLIDKKLKPEVVETLTAKQKEQYAKALAKDEAAKAAEKEKKAAAKKKEAEKAKKAAAKKTVKKSAAKKTAKGEE